MSAQIWLTDASATFNEFNVVWEEWVANVGKTRSRRRGVPLADAALTVEIMVTALR